MNAKQILKVLGENGLEDLMQTFLEEEYLEEEDLEKLTKHLGAVPKFVTSKRTADSGSDGYMWVFSLGEQYFMVVGDYCSWNGTTMYLNTLYEVEKKQKTITVYTAK